MRYIGIDYGTKKVGLALSDEAGRMGFPHSIIPNTAKLADELAALIDTERVEAVVIGESHDFDGAENAVAKDAKALGQQLSERLGIPVVYESETLTSAEARRQHAPEQKSRAPRSRADVDASAAALILTSYLSKHHG